MNPKWDLASAQICTDISHLLVGEESEGAVADSNTQKASSVESDATREPELGFSCPVDHQGTAVYVQGWARQQSDWPPVIFVHDLAENVELYAPAAKFLLKNGINSYSFDMRGHGRTTSMAGKMLSFADLINDLLQVVAWIRYKSGRQAPFLIGQGVGALLLLHFQLRYPQYCSACLIIAPTLQEQTVMPVFSRLLIDTMSYLAPGAPLPRFLLPYFLPMSDDLHLRGGGPKLKITARFARELLEAMHDADQVIAKIKSHTCVVCPEDESYYKADFISELMKKYRKQENFELLKLPHISAQPLTDDEFMLPSLLDPLVAWMQNHSSHAQAPSP